MEQTTVPPDFPNRLREKREAAMMTRAQVALRCKQLAAEDATRYIPVSSSAIRDLETGKRRPRPSTAATLAAALQADAHLLFPCGFDPLIRNPSGNTRIPADRRKGGRPSKSE